MKFKSRTVTNFLSRVFSEIELPNDVFLIFLQNIGDWKEKTSPLCRHPQGFAQQWLAVGDNLANQFTVFWLIHEENSTIKLLLVDTIKD